MAQAQRQSFDASFPEEFEWQSLDSVIASEVGARLAEEIRKEARHPPIDRLLTPGLREALRAIHAEATGRRQG